MTLDFIVGILAAAVVCVGVPFAIAAGVRHFAKPSDLDTARSKRRRRDRTWGAGRDTVKQRGKR